MRMVTVIAGTLLAVYVVIVAAAYFLQRQLMYFPDITRVAPAEAGVVGVEEIEITRPDGVVLVAWFRAPDPGQPTVLYFHGNGGSVAWRDGIINYWSQQGFGFLFPNYRGYGGSTGSPSEDALISDGLAAYGELERRGVDVNSVTVYGESLGSGVAVQVAAQRKAASVVLKAPFTSTLDVARRAYPFLPVRLLMHDRYESIDHIAAIDAPLLIIHGDADTVVPFALGSRLFEAAVEPKLFHAVVGAGHNDLDTAELRELAREFITSAVRGE